MEITIAALALLISVLTALYTRWTVGEAKKANKIGRLNALFAVREHYVRMMENQARLAKFLEGFEGEQLAHKAYADIDTKLRKVNAEIDKYHEHLVREQP